jgi:hypothetical protein
VCIRGITNRRSLTRNSYRHYLSSKVKESVKYLKSDNLEVEVLQIVSRRKLINFFSSYICAFLVRNTEKTYIAVVTLILCSDNLYGIKNIRRFQNTVALKESRKNSV